MAKLQKKFKTKSTAEEMKSFIISNLIPNPAISPFLKSTVWKQYKLYIDSGLGNGTIDLRDNEIEIDFELSVVGSLAKPKLESFFDDEIKKLQ